MSVEEAHRQAALETEARRLGIEPWQLEMSRAVPSDVIADIVRDNRKHPPTQAAEPVRRGSGWVEPRPLEPPPGIAIVDQLVDVQDALDRAELAKRLAKAGFVRRA